MTEATRAYGEQECRKAFEGVPVGAWAWHVHHEWLIELLDEPASNRIDYIANYKPAHEQKTRLALFRPVRGELPEAVVEAAARYNQARDRMNAGSEEDRTVWEEHNKAWNAYYEAWDAAKPALEALHAIECPDCPWDGRTIFPPASVKYHPSTVSYATTTLS